MRYDRHPLQYKRHGVISIFLCIILSAIVISESFLWLAAGKRAAEADLLRCMRLQSSQALSCYNQLMLDYYGIYVIDRSSLRTTVFDTCYQSQDEAAVMIEPTSEMTADAIRIGIVKFIQIRLPAFFATELISRIGLISDLIDESGVRKIFESSQGSSAWLTYLTSFISNKNEWSGTIKAAIELLKELDFTGTVEDVESFFESVQYIAERGGTSFLQGDMEVGDVLDVSLFANTLDLVEALYTPDLPDLLDTYLMDLYAASYFDSRIINEKDGADSKPEENIMGKKYQDLHSNNRYDLEYVLTGIENESVSGCLSYQLIGDIRVIFNFASNLMNKEKMEKSLGLANVLSTCITILSAGKVKISPKVLQYIVVFVWSIGEGIRDTIKLVNGESVPILTGDSFTGKYDMLNDALMTDYRDYIHILLFLVPGNMKTDRILKILTRDAGGEMYTGIRISADCRGNTYTMEDTYDAYRTT